MQKLKDLRLLDDETDHGYKITGMSMKGNSSHDKIFGTSQISPTTDEKIFGSSRLGDFNPGKFFQTGNSSKKVIGNVLGGKGFNPGRFVGMSSNVGRVKSGFNPSNFLCMNRISVDNRSKNHVNPYNIGLFTGEQFGQRQVDKVSMLTGHSFSSKIDVDPRLKVNMLLGGMSDAGVNGRLGISNMDKVNMLTSGHNYGHQLEKVKMLTGGNSNPFHARMKIQSMLPSRDRWSRNDEQGVYQPVYDTPERASKEKEYTSAPKAEEYIGMEIYDTTPEKDTLPFKPQPVREYGNLDVVDVPAQQKIDWQGKFQSPKPGQTQRLVGNKWITIDIEGNTKKTPTTVSGYKTYVPTEKMGYLGQMRQIPATARYDATLDKAGQAIRGIGTAVGEGLYAVSKGIGSMGNVKNYDKATSDKMAQIMGLPPTEDTLKRSRELMNVYEPFKDVNKKSGNELVYVDPKGKVHHYGGGSGSSKSYTSGIATMTKVGEGGGFNQMFGGGAGMYGGFNQMAGMGGYSGYGLAQMSNLNSSVQPGTGFHTMLGIAPPEPQMAMPQQMPVYAPQYPQQIPMSMPREPQYIPRQQSQPQSAEGKVYSQASKRLVTYTRAPYRKTQQQQYQPQGQY